MKNLNFGFDLGDRDLSFFDEMIAGGTSDDMSSRSGDISVDDNFNYLNYDNIPESTIDELEELLLSLECA